MEEVLKIAANGQWTLEKNWKAPQIKTAEKWVMNGQRADLNKLPAATGKLRNDMINHLGKESESRIHPTTGEKEYKVFRGAHMADDSHNDQVTSWSTSPSFAHEWSQHVDGSPKVMQAWVPEKHIHSYLPYIQEKHGHEKNEGEMLVHPHEMNIERTLIGKELEKENKKYGISKKKAPMFQTGHGEVNSKQSMAMHGKPHPDQPGRVWNHGTPSETGYDTLPGYSYDLEGDNWVGRKNGKIVHKSPL